MFSNHCNDANGHFEVRVDGPNVLDDVDAAKLLDKHPELGDWMVCIRFKFGETVSATTPAFWKTLIFDPLVKIVQRNREEKTYLSFLSPLERFNFIHKVPEGKKPWEFDDDERRIDSIRHRFGGMLFPAQGVYELYEEERIKQIKEAARVIIPINGKGVLDEAEARAIFDEHRESFEDENVGITFVIGEGVAGTSPEFWKILIFKPIIEMISEANLGRKFVVEHNPKVLSDRESRIIHRYSEMSFTSACAREAIRRRLPATRLSPL